MNEVFAVALGYALGSVLPAYFIGRARGIDLRSLGDHNLGTGNAYHELGPAAGAVTALYDVLKGPVVMLIAWQVLGVAPIWVYCTGAAAVAGHRYPFYLGFRGGHGYATVTGLLLFCIGYATYLGWFTWLDLAILVVVYLGLSAVYQTRAVPNALVLPIAYGTVLYRNSSAGNAAFDAFFGVVVAYIWLHNARRMRREHLLRLNDEARLKLREVRVLLRPGALAFPLLYLVIGKAPLLLLVGAVTLFFIAVDVSRLLWKRFNLVVFKRLAFFYRPSEERTFTSATLFLLGTFLTIFLFPKAEATTALIFVTFGDLAAKYAGLQHGRTRLFTTRTLEGSLMYFVTCAGAGFVWSWVVPIRPAQYLTGAIVAALTELVPWDLNDNFTVPLLAATAMTLPAFFGVPGF